jgi:hypothetical protein
MLEIKSMVTRIFIGWQAKKVSESREGNRNKE